jgi:hypothetical protein
MMSTVARKLLVLAVGVGVALAIYRINPHLAAALGTIALFTPLWAGRRKETPRGQKESDE